MQRPIMDPTFLPTSAPKARPRRRLHIHINVLPALKCAARVLLCRPFSFGSRKRTWTPMQFIAEGLGILIRQLLFAPVACSLIAIALVWAGTHPMPPSATADPTSQGVYYDPVSVASEDGTALIGWLVPAVDAHRVLEEKDKVLRNRWPAVVLVHDFGQSPQQMLPLVQPLHEEKMVVLAIGLRGVWTGNGRPAGQTFGLSESQDIKAAVEMLRRRPFVDPDRIAIVGIGSGATAALLAAEHDPQIAALVIADPISTASDALARRVAPREAWAAWMRPICKCAFELSYHVSADDINFERFAELIASRPILQLPATHDRAGYFEAASVTKIRDFLGTKLQKPGNDSPRMARAG